MKTSIVQEHSKGISTDAKFWFYLAPFLSASVIVWAYSVSWVLKEAPIAIPKLVASWQTGAQSEGDASAARPAVVPAVFGQVGIPKEKEKGPLFDVNQNGGKQTGAGGNGV